MTSSVFGGELKYDVLRHQMRSFVRSFVAIIRVQEHQNNGRNDLKKKKIFENCSDGWIKTKMPKWMENLMICVCEKTALTNKRRNKQLNRLGYDVFEGHYPKISFLKPRDWMGQGGGVINLFG